MKIIVAKRGRCYILIENRFCTKGMPCSDAKVKGVGKRERQGHRREREEHA
jgi:hypothetical protein